jgi:hypothetical protein
LSGFLANLNFFRSFLPLSFFFLFHPYVYYHYTHFNRPPQNGAGTGQ